MIVVEIPCMFSLHQKVALVTGATSGIGRAVALALGRAGAAVVLAGRRQAEGKAAVSEIEQAGGRAHFVCADVSAEAHIISMVHEAVVTFGRLDIAVNNAGTTAMGAMADITREDFRRVFDTNVLGVALCMKHEIVEMLRGGGGSIINVSSVAGTVAVPQSAIYVASKHAVEGLTRSAALDYARQGIRVNSLAPAGIATEMLEQVTGGLTSPRGVDLADRHPVGRIGTPEEVAAAVVYLASDEARFITGITLPVDGGWLVR